jgi:hypothetical protein
MNRQFVPRLPDNDTANENAYTLEAHEANIALLHDFGTIHGSGDEPIVVTPWMITNDGLARVANTQGAYRADLVEAIDSGFYDLAAHFVKYTVEVDANGTDIKTKLYQPIHQMLGIILINQPISAGRMAGYPVERSAKDVNRVLANHLQNPTEATVAKRHNMHGLFAARSMTLRHWVGVKL